MSAHTEFLEHIRTTPDDDAPRLVYADWLSERGDPRGALIVAQCELARLPVWDPRRAELDARVEELLDAHEEAWRAELPHPLGVAWGRFERGFVESAIITGSEPFVAHGEALVAATPLSSVRFRSIGDGAALVDVPALETLRRLELRHSQGRVLYLSPRWRRADSFTLLRCNLREHVAAFLATEHARRLVRLNLDHNYLGADNAKILAATIGDMAVTELELRRNSLNDAGLIALAQGDLSRLTSLGLAQNEITIVGLRALAECLARGSALESLDMRCNLIGDEGAQLLATHPGFATVRHLNVNACNVRDAGALALAGAEHLVALDIECNFLTDAGLDGFLRDGAIARLRRLALGFNELRPATAEWLESLPEVARATPQLNAPVPTEPVWDRLYQFSGEDHYQWSGFLRNGEQAVVLLHSRAEARIELLRYDRNGHFLSNEPIQLPPFVREPENRWEEVLAQELFEHLHTAIGFAPAEINIREWGHADHGDGYFEPLMSTHLDWLLGEIDWFDEEDLDITPQSARNWIASGEYSFSLGDGRWCYDHGECHTT